MKKVRRLLCIALIILFGGSLGYIGWLTNYLPDNYIVNQGETLHLANTPFVKASGKVSGQNSEQVGLAANQGSFSMQLRLFGVIPLKTVWVQQQEQKSVMVSGAPFGIKLFSDGVMIVGFSDIYTDTGYQNPAKSAGLHMGDTVHSIDGEQVSTNEDVRRLVEESQGEPLLVEYSRKGKTGMLYLTAVQDASAGVYRAGMRVRDSSAGIGTLTYYEKETGVFAGLGHAVTDVDTGESIEVLSGQIVPVDITGVSPSSVGSPGELKGILSGFTAGDIEKNTQAGVFGKLRSTEQDTFAANEYPVANRQETVIGEAQICVCIDGSEPRLYDAFIERIGYSEKVPNKNLIIRITDKALLEVSGGIVQGMSGSPIIQDGKIIGAVTHVLVNDPTRGYGIFIENMLDAAR